MAEKYCLNPPQAIQEAIHLLHDHLHVPLAQKRRFVETNAEKGSNFKSPLYQLYPSLMEEEEDDENSSLDSEDQEISAFEELYV